MSIISDALKKAQAFRSQLNKKENAAENAAENSTDPAPVEGATPEQMLDHMVASEKSKKDKIRKNSRLVSIGLAAVIVIVAGVAVFSFLTSKPEVPEKAAPKKVTIPKKAVRTVKPVPEKKPDAEAKAPVTKIAPKVKEEIESKTIPQEELKPPVKKEPAPRKIQYDYNTPTDLPTLNGIMYSPTYPRAIVDGSMVGEGEIVRGYRIKKILPDRIIVTGNGEDYELKLR